jgi:RNA polymerase sigma factor (sigma-70 family)
MTDMAVRRLTRVLQDIRRAALHAAASLDDGQLLDHFIERQDDAAFAALVQRHSAMVWGVCRRVLAHHHDAEDAFQATFLVLARKAASVRPRALVANWLYGVAHRTALKAKAIAGKRRTREKQVITMPEPQALQQDFWPNLESLIDQELAALPDKYRVVLLLCDLEGKTGREVARQLRIPEGTLAGRLRTGRLMLAKRLARHGFVLSGGALASVLSKNAASACAPPAVVSITIKTATLVAAGKTVAAGMISAKVAALTEGVLKAMFLTKLKATMLVVLLVAGLGGTAGLTYQMRAAEQPEAQHSKEKPTAPNAVDGKHQEKEKLDQAEVKLRMAEAQYWQKMGHVDQARAELAQAKADLEQVKRDYALAKIRYELIEKGESDKARHVTPNFVVVAATEDFARFIGERAEAERKRLALLWLGQGLPRWEQPCLVHVTLARGKKATGFASYAFEEKRRYAPKQEMWLEAERVQELTRDVLPQQVMHALLVHELGAGQPRWIEAGAGFMVQSEQARNERLVALPKALADGKTMPLLRSFEIRDYPGPKDLETWYSQSLSICQFLVDRKDRATLLAFVQRGMERGWDDAVRRYYGFEDVSGLDAAWQKSVKEMKVKAVEAKMPSEHANATIRGEILKVQLAELSVSILVDADKQIVYLTSKEEKKGDVTYRITDKTVVLRGDSTERMKFGQVQNSDRITIELDKAKTSVLQIRTHRKGQVGAIPVADKQILINSRSFTIPILLDPGRRDKIKRLALIYSTDKGDSWSPVEARFPEEVRDGFKFTANRDGVYWFSIQIEDKDGRLMPDQESEEPFPPHLKVQVDTSKQEKKAEDK